MMQNMAAMGRNGDTQLAHVSPGEMMVPRQVLDNNPRLNSGINSAIMDMGGDPNRYRVGNQDNSINPMTGQPEFFWAELLSFVKPILGSAAGKAALSSVATNLILGQKPTLRNTLLSGVLGGGINALGGGSVQDSFGLGQANEASNIINTGINTPGSNNLNANTTTPLSEVAQASANTGGNIKFRDDLMGAGSILSKIFPSLGKEGSTLGNILNTPAGEALLFGLGAQGLSMFDKEETDSMGDEANRPFGYGNVRVSAPMMRAAEGGQVPDYFPRRTGGIMPGEGSGTEDDVPAMLMAGEFVLNKPAIKGLGGGDQEKGIQRAYELQNTLEGIA
jgi:hypothetical protein